MWNRIPMIALACAMAVPAAAQPRPADKTSAVAVRFAPGASGASFNGRVRGNETVDYRLNAQAGQAMTVRFRPGNSSVEYVVLPPGSDTPIHNSRAAGDDFTGTLQASGTYVVRVYLAGGPARRNPSANYTLAFGIDGHGARVAEGPPPGPPARQDSTMRGPGPDARVVAGLAPGDVLTVRTGPSYSSRTVLRFPEGAALRSFGCQDVAGATWCSVAPPDAQRPAGWASARYLREVAAPAPAREARVPGTPYQATGQVDCRFQGQAPITCPFGVRRHGPQTATVDITLPSGQRRTLVFRSGQVSTEGREPVVASREADNMVVVVDGNERYVIPDLVIRGD